LGDNVVNQGFGELRFVKKGLGDNFVY
jgi:hypothetical protein